MATRTPLTTATQIVNTIAVDGHIAQGNPPNYANIADDINDQQYLGSTMSRQGYNVWWENYEGIYSKMAQVGQKFDFVIEASSTSDLQNQISQISQLAAANPGAVAIIEGPNEINNFPITYNGVGGLQGAINLQKDLYSMVHSDPVLGPQGTKVAYFTGWDMTGIGPDPSTTPGLADYDTQHPYPQNGQPPASWVNPVTALGNEPGGTGPAVYTETGYNQSGVFGDSNLNAQDVAAYDLDLIMDDAKNGISMTTFYEEMDGGDGWGLFDANNNPTPAATAIHNFTSALADKGTVSTGTKPIAFTVSGLPSNGNYMAVVKSTGATDIIVWAEPQVSGTNIGPTNNVTVNLGANYQTVKVFDPLTGSSAVQTLSNVSSVQLGITHHPLIVEVGPSGSGGTNPPPPPAPVTVGTGSDSLVLKISEDAYANGDGTSDAAGDARFTISIDGTQIGSTFTALASHSSGQDQIFTLNGNWAPGTHSVAVNFLNDAYAGSPSTDRNLYVDGVSYDGTNTGQSAALMSGGPHGFTINDTSPVPGSALAPISTGTGSDSLVLKISEDAYANGDGTSDAAGDAIFTVSIDGKQLAGIFTAHALHSAGQDQTFTFAGNWGPGTHTVIANFLNDAYAGTSSTDRNLYVDGVTYDGTNTNQGAALMSAGPKTFAVTDTTALPGKITGSGSDRLVIKVAEDYYLANAQFTVAVDGKQLGGTFTATTLHSSGGSQTFTFAGDFGAGAHNVAVAFVNDAYAGTPSTDRNLYVNDIIYNGTDTGQNAALMSNGPRSFTINGGTTPAVSETGDHGTLQKNLSQTGTYTVGGDTFVIGSGNAASVTLGTGTSQISFIGPSSLGLTGGSGVATVKSDTGNNKFTAGTGSLDVTGGGGKDTYVFHASGGLLRIEDFSVAKGDKLAIDTILQSSMVQGSDGEGGTLLTFGSGAAHGIDVHGLASVPSSAINWM